MCSTVLLGWLCHRVCHVVGSYLVFNSLFLIFFLIPQLKCMYDETSFFKEGEGSIYYLAAYNSSVGRGLDTKLSTCGN